MSLAETLLLALALSMDAFAVSMAAGMSQKSCNFKKALILGATFGIFQALMPALGFFASAAAHIYISKIDHWIAFGLLAFIGAKMVSESLRSEENSHGYRRRAEEDSISFSTRGYHWKQRALKEKDSCCCCFSLLSAG